MQARLNFAKAAPEAIKAVAALDRYAVKESGLEPSIIHLIKLRASQINGCAYCVDMHVKESRHDGLSEQWINLTSVWQESTVYTPAERAVLGWTEVLTLVSQTRAPDADYEELRKHFSEEDCVKITVAIGAINVWNRLAVGFRAQHPIDKPKVAAA
jgi:AhpD family alkylhydroperoxidase